MDLRLEAAEGSDGSQHVNISGGLQTHGCLGARDYRQRNTIEHLKSQEEARETLFEKSRCKSSWEKFFKKKKERKKQKHTHRPDRTHAKKTSEKILSLHPRLISRLRSPLNSKGVPRRQQTLGESTVFINAQFSPKKNTRHTKKQENVAHSKEQNKSLETVSKETHVLNLLDKDFKTTVINMLKELKKNMDRNQETDLRTK